MSMIKRCKECIRPICQRQLTLRGCKYINSKEISQETIDSLSINKFEMIDQFMG